MSAWEQQDDKGESQKAYAAFCVYRDIGPSRSLAIAYRQGTGKEQAKGASGLWTNWYDVFDWKERARAYDAHLELTARQGREAEHAAELAAYRERSRKAAESTFRIANNVLLLAGQRLQQMVEGKEAIPAESLPAYLRAAAAVMESSLNAEAEAIGVRRLESLLDDADKDKEPG